MRYQLLLERGTPLFRYHGDIDFMIAEQDIEKVRVALAGTDYVFLDNRFDNKKRFTEGVGHTQGEHEVIANHKDNEFHLGFFLFRREPDQTMTIREYFMQERENGLRIPMVLERNYPKELVDLEYTEQETEFAGTRFRTSTPESVYAKKMYTRHQKDMLDIEALKDKVDERKIAEAMKYQTTLKVVEATPERTDVGTDVLREAIEATEGTIRTGTINEQTGIIRDVRDEKAVPKEGNTNSIGE